MARCTVGSPSNVVIKYHAVPGLGVVTGRTLSGVMVNRNIFFVAGQAIYWPSPFMVEMDVFPRHCSVAGIAIAFIVRLWSFKDMT
jgi:hypothetical protein